jgi:pimeloyl-ACP methyl ester carboxylesterase
MSARLHAAELGSGATTIVLLHGFAGCSGLWHPIQLALAREAHTMAYDLPGHGKSLDWPEAGPAKVAVAAIQADLALRGIESFHLVGHSMGGAVAALMAIAEPSRVLSLTLLAPGGFGEEINGSLLRRYAAAKTDDEVQSCLKMMIGPSNRVPADAVLELAKMRALPGQTEKLAEIAASIARNDRQGVIARDKLAALPMPVSVAWGTLDPVLPVGQTAGLPPQFALHLVPDAGHMLPEEVPDLVTALIHRNAR